MNKKYSLLNRLYGLNKTPLRENKYSLRSLLLEGKAGIDAQIKVGSWALQRLNKSQAGRYWGHYVDGGNFPDVRIYDSRMPHPENPDWHKCVLQIEVKDGSTMNDISIIKGDTDDVVSGIYGWLEAKKSMYDSMYTNPETQEESPMWFGNMVAGTVTNDISKARKNDGWPMVKDEETEKEVRKKWEDSDLFVTRGTLVENDKELLQKLKTQLRNAIEWVRENHSGEKGWTMIHGHYDAPWNPQTGEISMNFRWETGGYKSKKTPGKITATRQTPEGIVEGGLWTGDDKKHVIRRMQKTFGPKIQKFKMDGSRFVYQKNPKTGLREKIPDGFSQGEGYPLAAIMVISDGKGKVQGKWYDFPAEQQREDYLKQNADFKKVPGGKELPELGKVGSTQLLKRKSFGTYTPAEGEDFNEMMHRHLEHENETHYAVVKDDNMYIAEVGSVKSVLKVGKAIFDDTPMIKKGSQLRTFKTDRNVTRENFFFTMSGGVLKPLPATNDSGMFPYNGPAGKIAAGLTEAHKGFGEKPQIEDDGE